MSTGLQVTSASEGSHSGQALLVDEGGGDRGGDNPPDAGGREWWGSGGKQHQIQARKMKGSAGLRKPLATKASQKTDTSKQLPDFAEQVGVHLEDLETEDYARKCHSWHHVSGKEGQFESREAGRGSEIVERRGGGYGDPNSTSWFKKISITEYDSKKDFQKKTLKPRCMVFSLGLLPNVGKETMVNFGWKLHSNLENNNQVTVEQTVSDLIRIGASYCTNRIGKQIYGNIDKHQCHSSRKMEHRSEKYSENREIKSIPVTLSDTTERKVCDVMSRPMTTFDAMLETAKDGRILRERRQRCSGWDQEEVAEEKDTSEEKGTEAGCSTDTILPFLPNGTTGVRIGCGARHCGSGNVGSALRVGSPWRRWPTLFSLLLLTVTLLTLSAHAR